MDLASEHSSYLLSDLAYNVTTMPSKFLPTNSQKLSIGEKKEEIIMLLNEPADQIPQQWLSQ